MVEMSVPDDVDRRATLTDLDAMLGELELSVSKSAQRLKHINIHKQTLNDTCQKDTQSKTKNRVKGEKDFFLLLSQLQQKFPPSHCFIIGIFFEKV